MKEPDPLPVTSERELALLRRVISGDPRAVETAQRWIRETLRFKFPQLRADDRDDLVQETLAQVWRLTAREGFVLRKELRALVTRVATARGIDRLRRSRHLESVPADLEDPRPNPYEECLRGDENARLRWALFELGDACRELIRLHFYDSLPYAEISSRLGRTEGALRVQMHKCVRSIRRMLGREGA